MSPFFYSMFQTSFSHYFFYTRAPLRYVYSYSPLLCVLMFYGYNNIWSMLLCSFSPALFHSNILSPSLSHTTHILSMSYAYFYIHIRNACAPCIYSIRWGNVWSEFRMVALVTLAALIYTRKHTLTHNGRFGNFLAHIRTHTYTYIVHVQSNRNESVVPTNNGHFEIQYAIKHVRNFNLCFCRR